MKIMLLDSPADPVRLAFLHVFSKRPGMKNQDGSTSPDKYEVNAIIKPGGANEARLREAIAAVAKEKYGDGWKAIYDDEFADDQRGIRKGALKKTQDGEVYDGFADMLYVAARNEVRPTVLNKDRSPLIAEDGVIYSGCYANVSIDVWALAKRGVKKRIVTDLLGVQFSRDGDAFSAGAGPAKPDDFPDLSAEESAGESLMDG